MKVVRNIIKVIASNLITIISGIVVAFLLPKIISISDYGFYKIFTLYFNYLGVLSLGIIDGIVLKYGDREYEDFDRNQFRGFFVWYSILHILLTFVILLATCIFSNVDYKFIVLMLALNLFPSNVTGYFQQISQITQRFNEYSLRKILQSVSNIALVLLMYVLYKGEIVQVTYKIYVIGLLLVNILLAGWYLYTYKDIVFGGHRKLSCTLKEIIGLVRIGFPLLLANLCSTLLLSLDRQFVSVLFSTEEYATYAFAYSMLSLITVVTSAIATVLYPMFKRANENVLIEYYPKIQALILSLMSFVMLVYFPLAYFLEFFLPNYMPSLEIFRIILPSLVINSLITILLHNYYKVFGKSQEFFFKSIVALGVSFVMNMVAYVIFHTMTAISIASVFVMFVWYINTEYGIRKICSLNSKAIVYLLVMMGAFYCFTSFDVLWIGAICYFTFWTVFSVFQYKCYYTDVWQLFKYGKK